MLKRLSKTLFVLMLILSLSSVSLADYSFKKDYDAIDLAAKSVFYVEMYDRNDRCFGSASGFVAFDEHLFVTNEHVVNGASYIKVWDEDNKMYFIDQLIAVDKVHDIAVLVFPEGKQYAALELDPNNDLNTGEPVIAIGSPKGFQGTVSRGKINALVKVEMYSGTVCIQHTAPSSPGSSGGCLFADNGKVIGITSAGTDGEPVLNIAVPVHYLQLLYDNWNKRDYKALDSGYHRNDDSSSITGAKDKTNFADITGGKIETFVAIPEDVDLDDYFYPMESMTVSDFLDNYNKVCKTLVKDAPAITNRKFVKPYVWSSNYCVGFDLSRGIGSAIYAVSDSIDVPIDHISIKIDASTRANARACAAVFMGDSGFFDEISSIYEGNDCEPNNLYAVYLTKDGYCFVYSGNNSGDRVLSIYCTVPY